MYVDYVILSSTTILNSTYYVLYGNIGATSQYLEPNVAHKYVSRVSTTAADLCIPITPWYITELCVKSSKLSEIFICLSFSNLAEQFL